MIEAFKEYLLETFEEEFDDQDFRHLAYLGVFEAGYDKGWNAYGDRE